LGENSLRCEGKFDPTDKISTPEIIIEKMFEVRFAADEELMELIRWAKVNAAASGLIAVSIRVKTMKSPKGVVHEKQTVLHINRRGVRGFHDGGG
jgi:hypothetical protein